MVKKVNLSVIMDKKDLWLHCYLAVISFFEAVVFRKYKIYMDMCKKFVYAEFILFILAGAFVLERGKICSLVVWLMVAQYMISSSILAIYICAFLPRSLFGMNQMEIKEICIMGNACRKLQLKMHSYLQNSSEVTSFRMSVLLRVKEEMSRLRIIRRVLGPILVVIFILNVGGAESLSIISSVVRLEVEEVSKSVLKLRSLQRVLVAGGVCATLSLWLFAKLFSLVRETQYRAIEMALTGLVKDQDLRYVPLRKF